MANVKTDSGKWVECTYAEAKEYAEHLRKRFSKLTEFDRERKVSERVLLTLKESVENEVI